MSDPRAPRPRGSDKQRWTFEQKFDHQLDENNKLTLEIEHREQPRSTYSVTLGKKRRDAEGQVFFAPHLPVEITRQNGKVTVNLHTKELTALLEQATEYLTVKEQLAYDEEIEERQKQEASRDRIKAPRPGLKELSKREKKAKQAAERLAAQPAPVAPPKEDTPS
jgi:hypothetical protein